MSFHSVFSKAYKVAGSPKQAVLARKASDFMPAGRHISRHQISQYLAGQKEPREDIKVALAQALGRPEEYFTKGIIYPPPTVEMHARADGRAQLCIEASFDWETAFKIMALAKEGAADSADGEAQSDPP